jgi:hypothetical protein
MCSRAYRISVLDLAQVKLHAEFQQYTDRRTVLSNGIMWFIRHEVKAAYGRQRILARWIPRSITDRPYVPAAFQLHA